MIQRQGAVLGVLAGTLRTTIHQQEIARFPADLVEEVLIFGGVSVTTPALRDLLSSGASLHVLTLGGRHLGCLTPGLLGHASLLRAQVQADSPSRQAAQAAALLRAKLQHSRAVLRRWLARHPHPALQQAADTHTRLLAHLLPDAHPPLTTTLESLLGTEGAAAAAYFGALAATLPPEWGFTGRQRRPPPDPVNALLSLGYSMLFSHVLTDIQRVGLHPGFAALHQPHGRRPILAMDLMEPHRAPLVDRTVLACINRRLLSPDDFELSSEGIRLGAEGRARFLGELNRRLNTPIGKTGPTFRELITRQVRRYAEDLRAERIFQPELLR